jgi:hypothetical protein
MAAVFRGQDPNVAVHAALLVESAMLSKAGGHYRVA